MSTDENWLFDPFGYGGEPHVIKVRTIAPEPTVEPYQKPWLLLANRSGVIGFHWPKSANEYHTTFALCGVKGHAVEPPETMIRCADCEHLRLLP